MRFNLQLLAISLCGLLPSLGVAEIVSTRILDLRDDAEQVVGSSNVQRTNLDLRIDNDNGVSQVVGLLFKDLAIPKNATINSVTIQFTGADTDVGTLSIPIFGELSPDPADFSDVEGTPIIGRTRTVSSVLWDNVDPWFPGDSGVNTTTPNLAPIVQEIVNQSGWTSGNAMAMFFDPDPDTLDTSERIAVSFDGNPLQSPLLTINFTRNAIPEPTSSFLIFSSLLILSGRKRIGN